MDVNLIVKLLSNPKLIWNHTKNNIPLRIINFLDLPFLIPPNREITPEKVSFTEWIIHTDELYFLDKRLKALSPTYPLWINHLRQRLDAPMIMKSIAETILRIDEDTITIFHLIHVFTELYAITGAAVEIPFGQPIKVLYQKHSYLYLLISYHRYLNDETIIPERMFDYATPFPYLYRLTIDDSLSNMLLSIAGGIRVNREYRSEQEPKNLGDDNCENSAKSPYLRCAINPVGPCMDCPDFKEVS